jgi:hypothetical protein
LEPIRPTARRFYNENYKLGKNNTKKIIAARPNVSIFSFREPGKNINKLKKWDNSIIIDSTKELFKLLFKKRCTCSSSIAIAPNKRFGFLRSDSHSEILTLKPKQLELLLQE